MTSVDTATGEIVEIPLDKIAPGSRVRAEALDLDHVALMVPVIDSLPPIVVRQDDKGYLAEDGNHRVAAHRRAGRTTIRAVVVEATEAEALELAVAANRKHGKPLTVSELKAVAKRMIADTDWSNVRIAEACGLSDKTVAELRPRPTAESPRLDTPPAPAKTEGADGKRRPSSASVAADNRERIRAVADAKPDASAREIAAEVGVSPTTVTSTLSNPRPSLSVVSPPAEDDEPSVEEVVLTAPVAGRWSTAPGFEATNAARELARFLDRRLIRLDEDVAVLADGCPVASRGAVAMVAAESARQWQLLAEHLSTPTRLKGVR